MTDKIFIVAGNFQQFSNYKKSKVGEALAKDDAGLGMETAMYTYVSRPSILKGVSNPRGVFIGSWRQREDILEILIQLRVAQRQPNPILDRLYREVEQKATATQYSKAKVHQAAQQLADAIDQEVLNQLKQTPINLPKYISQSTLDAILNG